MTAHDRIFKHRNREEHVLVGVINRRPSAPYITFRLCASDGTVLDDTWERMPLENFGEIYKEVRRK